VGVAASLEADSAGAGEAHSKIDRYFVVASNQTLAVCLDGSVRINPLLVPSPRDF
jgi:hypothetical protein